MKKLLLSILLTTAIAFSGYAQIVTFSFTGAAGNESSFAPDVQPTNAVVSSMVRGSGITAGTNANTFSASGWTTNATIDLDDYYQFTITPNANVTLSLSSLTLSERRSLTGIRKWEVRSSVDGYTSTLGTIFSVPDDDLTRDNQIINLPATTSFTASTSAITFRIYGYEAEGSSGTWRIDNVKLFGTVTLPVSLTSFIAKANLQNIDLTWNTASEKDNSHFEVLRSGDGKTFSKIGEVKVSGTSSYAKSYNFTDKDALPGVSYYQLRQVDADGKSSDSEVVAVKSNVAASNFQVVANRQEGSAKFTIFAANAGKGSIKIYDLNGRKLTEQQLALNKGYNNVSIPFNGANGLHVASLTTANETVTQKFIQ